MKIVLTMTSPTVPQEREQQYSRIIKQLEKNEPLTLNELAVRTSINMSYLWVMINDLVKQGRVVIQRVPREGSTFHGYLPKYVFRYTVPGKQESEPMIPEEGETAAEQVSATTERVRTRERIAYDEGFEAGRAEEKKNYANAVAYATQKENYDAGFKAGREGYEAGSWKQGFESGKKAALQDIDSAKNVAHADGYHVGYKQGRLDTLEKELPLRQKISFNEGRSEGVAAGINQAHEALKRVMESSHLT
jgi:hypothetical protein